MLNNYKTIAINSDFFFRFHLLASYFNILHKILIFPLDVKWVSCTVSNVAFDANISLLKQFIFPIIWAAFVDIMHMF